MGIESAIGFLFDGIGQPIAADHHHRIQVMGFGTVDFALGRGQLN
jgi:hypothetical protein